MSARDVTPARNGVVCLFVCCMHIFFCLLDRTSDGVLLFYLFIFLVNPAVLLHARAHPVDDSYVRADE